MNVLNCLIATILLSIAETLGAGLQTQPRLELFNHKLGVFIDIDS